MAFEHAKNWCASAIIHHTLLEYFGYVVMIFLMCMPLGIVGMKREKIITNEHYQNFHWFSCWFFGGVFEHTHLLYVVFGASISGISFLPLAVQSIKAVTHPTLSSNTEKSTILPLSTRCWFSLSCYSVLLLSTKNVCASTIGNHKLLEYFGIVVKKLSNVHASNRKLGANIYSKIQLLQTS